MSDFREPPLDIELPEMQRRDEQRQAQVLLFRVAVERYRASKAMTQPYPAFPVDPKPAA